MPPQAQGRASGLVCWGGQLHQVQKTEEQSRAEKDPKCLETLAQPITGVFVPAGLNGRAIGGKSLISFSSGWTLIIKQQILSSTIKQQSAFVMGGGNSEALPSQIPDPL